MKYRNHLRKVRREKGIAQYELSARTKITPAIISLIENEHIVPSNELKKRLAKGLNVPVREIFPEE